VFLLFLPLTSEQSVALTTSGVFKNSEQYVHTYATRIPLMNLQISNLARDREIGDTRLVSSAHSVDSCFSLGVLKSTKCNGKLGLVVSGGLGSCDSQTWSFVLWYYCSSNMRLIKSSDIACGRVCICLNVGSCGSRNVWHADPLGFASQPSAGGVVT
jgi:hypothetical protein